MQEHLNYWIKVRGCLMRSLVLSDTLDRTTTKHMAAELRGNGSQRSRLA
jgi:hypothetical protein